MIPELKVGNWTLSEFQRSDAASVFEYASNPEVARYVTWDVHQSLTDSEQFIEYARSTRTTSAGRPLHGWAIRNEIGKAVGSFQYLKTTDLEGQIDYALSEKYWGKGVMSTLARGVISWAFENDPTLMRIRSMALAENVGSIRVQEKAGMKYEGTLRSYMEFKGQYRDLELRDILRSEAF